MTSAPTPPAPRVVITGMGAVSPLGVGVPALARALRAGESGVKLLPFEHPRLRSSVAAMLHPTFAPTSVVGDADAARLPRVVPPALAAAQEAAAQAGLSQWLREGEEQSPLHKERARRVGLVLGTGGGGIEFTLEQARAAYEGRKSSLWSITNATHGNLAGELSIRLGLRGRSWCTSTGCASASDAVFAALEALRSPRPGAPDAMVVVGADAHVCWETLAGMELLRVISTRDFRASPAAACTASRPFDATRDGFVLGEGAFALVLEREESRAARGGPAPLGEVLGAGATCDAYHRVRPEPDMGECVRAMRDAIDDARIAPSDVEVVHYHGTATPMNDALETRAVRTAFGAHAGKLAGHSVKGALGHPQGASGLMAVVSTLSGLLGSDGGGAFLLPTLNLRERDPACDLDYTPLAARPTRARTALVNCLAFGAKNTALVVRAGA